MAVAAAPPWPCTRTLRFVRGFMYDYGSGLDSRSLRVAADFPVDGIPSGRELAPRFKPKSQGVWELMLSRPIHDLPKGRLVVSVEDRQGNVAKIERVFSVGSRKARR